MKVLFFAPHAGIVEHASAERHLADACTASGWQTIVVSCHGVLGSYCNVMAAKNIRPLAPRAGKRLICHGCTRAAGALYGSEFAGRRIALDDSIGQADMAEVVRLVRSASVDSWAGLEFHGHPVGRLAAYEFMLTYKLNEMAIPHELWAVFELYLENVVISVLGAERILSEHTPDRVILYNSLYGVNRVWQRVAESMGIPTYAIQHNISAPRVSESLMMYRNDSARYLVAHGPEAADSLLRALSEREVEAAQTVLLTQLGATNVFVYSRAHEGIHPRDVRARLGLDDRRPVLLVPLSSEDERFAAALVDVEFMQREPRTFPTQLSWIEHLKRLAAARPDLQLVIRPHPRMFPNRRESVLAPAGQEILDALVDVPRNLRVNVPADALSLMDLMQVVDVCLAGRSTVGSQLSAFGIPLVIHDPEVLNAFPSQLGFVARDVSEYEAVIDRALAEGWSFMNVVRSYRWLWFANNILARDISGRASHQPVVDSPSASRRVPATVSRAAIRMVAHLPETAASGLKGQKIHLAAKSEAASVGTARDAFGPFLDVLSDELGGVHQIAVPSTSTEQREARAIRGALEELLVLLGEFTEDPRSLSARLRRFLDSGEP